MEWLNTAFPWIGLAGAAVLLLLLFASSLLRSDAHISQWRDPTWLSWAGVAASPPEPFITPAGCPRSFCF